MPSAPLSFPAAAVLLPAARPPPSRLLTATNKPSAAAVTAKPAATVADSAGCFLMPLIAAEQAFPMPELTWSNHELLAAAEVLGVAWKVIAVSASVTSSPSDCFGWLGDVIKESAAVQIGVSN